MRYHITIRKDYWRSVFPEWPSLTPSDQRALQELEIGKMNEFLSSENGVLFTPGLHIPGVPDELRHLVVVYPLFEHPSLDLIAQERDEQITKHGFTPEHDDALDAGQLEEAAAALLTEDPERWPAHLSRDIFHRASEKPTLNRLAVAAALIAAEMDRIIRADKVIVKALTLPGPNTPGVGDQVRLADDVKDQMERAGLATSTATLSLSGTVHHIIGIAVKLDPNDNPVRVADIGYGVQVPLSACERVQPTYSNIGDEQE